MDILATFVARLLDPLLILVAVLGGALSLRWWHVAGAAAAAIATQETTLFQIQLTRTFQPISVAIGFVAAAVWTVVAYKIKLAVSKSEAS